MSDVLEIELPKSVSEAEAAELEAALSELHEVEAAGPTETRAIDPVSIGVWIKLVELSLGGVKKVAALISGRGIEGAKFKVGDTVISADRISADDLERLIKVAREG